MTDGELRAWAERMKAALESIVDGVENYDDHEPGDRLSAERGRGDRAARAQPRRVGVRP
jgi:hypothetical protein